MKPPSVEEIVRWGTRSGLSLLLLWAVAVLAHVPLGAPAQEAWLRLDLHTRAGRHQVCRERTPEELATLPMHMRQPRVCEELILTYQLEVEVDGKGILERTVAPRGVRHNRPLVAEEVLRLDPGEHQLRVRFGPERPEELLPEVGDAVPDFELEETLLFAPGRITVLTLAGEGWRVLGG